MVYQKRTKTILCIYIYRVMCKCNKRIWMEYNAVFLYVTPVYQIVLSYSLSAVKIFSSTVSISAIKKQKMLKLTIPLNITHFIYFYFTHKNFKIFSFLTNKMSKKKAIAYSALNWKYFQCEKCCNALSTRYKKTLIICVLKQHWIIKHFQ